MARSLLFVRLPPFLRNSQLIGWMTASLTNSSRILRMTAGIPMLSEKMMEWSLSTPQDGYVTGFGIFLFHPTLGVG